MRCILGKRARESGQTAPLIGLLLGILVIFVAFSINAGLIVNDRIRIQNTADLAAYAGAAKEAEILNNIKRINDGIMRDTVDMRNFLMQHSVPGDFLTYDGGTICSCDMRQNPGMEAKIQQFEAKMMQAHQKILNENQKNRQVWSATQNTADANYEGTKNKTKPISHRQGDAVMPLKMVNEPFQYALWEYICVPFPVLYQPCGMSIIPHRIDTWVYKAYGGSGDMLVTPGGMYPGYQDTVNVVQIEQIAPTHGLVDFPNSVFDPHTCSHAGGGMDGKGNCKMNAYAAARPYVGKMGPIEASGPGMDTSLIRTSQQLMGPSPNCPGPCMSETIAINQLGQLQNQYDTYYARPTGVFERQSKQAGTFSRWEIMVRPTETMDNIMH